MEKTEKTFEYKKTIGKKFNEEDYRKKIKEGEEWRKGHRDTRSVLGIRVSEVSLDKNGELVENRVVLAKVTRVDKEADEYEEIKRLKIRI
jgi:hypothetical protein